MALRVARVSTNDGTVWAVESPDGLRRLSQAYATTRDFFEQGGAADAEAAMTDGAQVEATAFLSPVTQDAKFVCQATNYADHIREVGGDPSHVVNNILFVKASSCIAPPDSDIICPAHVQLLDYEIELGLVLKRGFDGPQAITPETLADWVGGLVIVNDITARDVQISHMQFHKSKSYRTFGPVGPWLVLPTPDELARLFELELELKVDGEVRQKALAREMIFKPAETLTELSQIMDLAPGDLIATGTPAGVALRPPPSFIQALAGFMSPAARFKAFLKGQLKRPQYLKPGQTMTSTVRSADGALDLGQQTNRVVAASSAPGATK
jgi:2-keto-4-pentenoate hydratase/2-oxohepta-3-ene-1,7-dioic acid hydratase in catechol pathway